MYLETLGKAAKAAKYELALLDTNKKNDCLLKVAAALEDKEDVILAANKIDIDNGVAAGMHPGLVDRLKLTSERIKGIAEGIRQVEALDDPVGNVLDEYTRPNGMKITKVSVPLGVIGIIYESRPNVTADAF